MKLHWSTPVRWATVSSILLILNRDELMRAIPSDAPSGQ
jgi:hypothetical protein